MGQLGRTGTRFLRHKWSLTRMTVIVIMVADIITT